MGDYGGLAVQFNHLAIVLGLTVSGHAGVAITYDARAQRTIQKLAKGRSAKTDYFAMLINLNRDIRADVVQDFEARTEATKKEKEKDKEKNAKDKEKGGKKGDKDKEKTKNKDKEGNRRSKKWTATDWKDYWGEWKNNTQQTTDGAKQGKRTRRKEGGEVSCLSDETN